MTATKLVRPPAHAPGMGMTELAQRTVCSAISPTITFASTDYTSTGAVLVPLFETFPGVVIVDMKAINTVAWNGTGNVFSVSDTDSISFLASSDWTTTAVGCYHASGSGLGREYSSSDARNINASVLVSTGSTGGSSYVMCLYTYDLIAST